MPKISKRSEESDNYMDKLQDEGQMMQDDKEVQQEPMNSDLQDAGVDADNAEEVQDERANELKFDRSNVELDVPLEEFEEEQPEEVDDGTVIYVPHKDFGARINQTEYIFRKGVKTRVDKGLAGMLLEDESRGYVYE